MTEGFRDSSGQGLNKLFLRLHTIRQMLDDDQTQTVEVLRKFKQLSSTECVPINHHNQYGSHEDLFLKATNIFKEGKHLFCSSSTSSDIHYSWYTNEFMWVEYQTREGLERKSNEILKCMITLPKLTAHELFIIKFIAVVDLQRSKIALSISTSFQGSDLELPIGHFTNDQQDWLNLKHNFVTETNCLMDLLRKYINI